METATLSTKGQLVIPNRFRRALNLRPGDRLAFFLEGGDLVLRKERRERARLVEKSGRKVLVAAPDAPAMTPEAVKALLADFP